MSARKMVKAHRRLLESSDAVSPGGTMSGKKRELEIVFNLLWSQRPLNADDRSNVVGMYDVPSTTLTWEKFKAYLLKNSGSPCADIEVTYIDSDNKEVPIDSQEKFLLAMYAFRKRARIGDIITLKLDKVAPPQQKKKIKPDVEPDVAEEPTFMMDDEVPPAWFTKYMRRFKRELVEEVSSLVTRSVPRLWVPKESSREALRKSKGESFNKKPRKLSSAPTQTVSVGNVELKKYMKFESKLEKLEQKSLKIKAKKLALKVKEAPPTKRLIGLAPTDVELFMNATPVDNHMPTAPRMLGGEVYLQQWRVANSGELPWSNDTQLRLAWGSKELVPIDKTVACPHLMPGEEGQISVLLGIPVTPGRYECYWHLYHNGVRFGHWLGCFVIVDEPPIKPHLLHTVKENNFQTKNEQPPLVANVANIEKLFTEKLQIETAGQEKSSFEKKDSGEGSSRSSSVSNASYVFVNDADEERKEAKREDEEEEEERDASSEEDIEKVENEEEDEKKESDENNESCNGGLDVDENIAPEYAYILYNGEKFPLHKKFLTEECFQRSEKVQNIPMQEDDTSAPPQSEETNKEESQIVKRVKERTVSESSSNRLFVFPQHSPGFEVVYPEEKRDEVLVDLSFDSNSPECRESNELDTTPPSSVPFTVKCVCPNAHKPKQCFDTSFPFNTGPCDCNYCTDEDYSSWEQPEYAPYCCKHLNHSHHKNNPEYYHSPDCNFHYNQAKQNYYANKVFRKLQEENQTQEKPVQTEQQVVQVQPEQQAEAEPVRNVCGDKFENSFHSSAQSCCGNSGSFYGSLPTRNSLGGEVPMTESVCSGRSHTHRRASQQHRKPENLITGAAILASSALSTARSMMDMVLQTGGGKWVNGHWVVDNPNTKREIGLRTLAEMGFMNRDLNATLLARYNDDVHRVISELIL